MQLMIPDAVLLMQPACMQRCRVDDEEPAVSQTWPRMSNHNSVSCKPRRCAERAPGKSGLSIGKLLLSRRERDALKSMNEMSTRYLAQIHVRLERLWGGGLQVIGLNNFNQ